MKFKYSGFFLNLIFIFLFTSIISCKTTYNEKQKADIIRSTAFISDKDSILKSMQKELNIYNFVSGETVADIGSGTAWFEGVIALCCDSLTVYAGDISSKMLKRINIVADKYAELKQENRKNTNKYLPVKGKTTSTNMPVNTMDKVLIRQTFHEFSKPDQMLQDIFKIMKDSAILFIYDPVAEGKSHKADCSGTIYCKEDFLLILERNNFRLVQEYDLLDNHGNFPPWYPSKKDRMKLYVLKKNL